MKVIKKMCVFIIVGVVLFSSVFASYNKAVVCKAVALPVVGELGKDAILLILMALGVTAVGGVVLDENSSDAEWKKAYENDKETYEQLQKYYTDQSAYANAKLKTVSGESVLLSDAIKDDYVSLEKYKELRKNNPNPTKMPGIDWNSVMFGADVLELLSGFFNKKSEPTNCLGEKWLCYTGDSGYYENGKLNILLRYGLTLEAPNDDSEPSVYPYCWNFTEDLLRSATTTFNGSDMYRAAVFVSEPFFTDGQGWNSYVSVHVSYKKSSGAVFTDSISNCGTDTYLIPYSFSSNGTVKFICSNLVPDLDELGTLDGFGGVTQKTSLQKMGLYAHTSLKSSSPTDFYMLSTNLPIFIDKDEMQSYLLGSSNYRNKYKNPYNGFDTAVNVVTNNFNNKVVSVTDLQNFINNITNNITNNNITVNNYSSDYVDVVRDMGLPYGTDYIEPTATPKPTAAPKPTATLKPTATPTVTPYPTWSGDGPANFTTYNFFTEISNILNPVKTTIENIYNFFVIDTEEVGSAINDINVFPTGKFDNFVSTFDNLSNTFSDNVQEECSEGQYGIKYPVIKVQCPKILLDFVPDNSSVVMYEDGLCYLVLADCIKFAKYFVKVRAFLKACIWIGMIFYLMKELKPVITLSD